MPGIDQWIFIMLNVSSRLGSDLVNIYLHKTIDQYAQSTAAVVNKNPVVLICEDGHREMSVIGLHS